jgi:type II secretory pathway pseudopilin PulG
MLVVVAIIAVLAGLLIPVVGVVKRMANDVKCGSQLQQIGAAIEVYKNDNEDRFPLRLVWDDADPLRGNPVTSDLVHSGGPLYGLQKIFKCPRDPQNGKDRLMGRFRPGGNNGWDDLSGVYTPGSSYLYEVSGHFLNSNLLNFFFEDLSQPERPLLNTVESTWAAGKHHQLRFGNIIEGSNPKRKGAPFPSSLFPIVRCYWHTKWTGDKDKDSNQRRGVRNISWDLNVFDTSPYWEHDVNPQIPP